MSSGSDPQGDSSNIVDFELLEKAKENVQPLATGRRVTALSALLSTPHAEREAKLSATRNRLRINVELALEDEDGDPLEAYCRLVYWTVENYPQGHSAESGLLELLEEATRVLKDDRDGQWRGDLKYLKLWLLYASYVEKPTIVYKFLIANDIGTEFALLYEEHAAVLERDGRRREADEAYALGIARKATPLDHLESRYSDFQKRMMSNVALPNAEPAPSITSQAPRQALTTTKTTAPASSSRASSSRGASSSTPSLPSSSSNSRIQIFVDPTGEGAEASEGTENAWTDLGTRKARIKENIPEVKKLAGTTVKQAGRSKRVASSSGAGGAASGSSSKIIPFRDPAPGEMPPPPVPIKESRSLSKTGMKGFKPFVDEDSQSEVANATPPADTTPNFTPFRDESAASSAGTVVPITDSIMKVKKAGIQAPVLATEAEALRKDPLKNYPQDAGKILAQDG